MKIEVWRAFFARFIMEEMELERFLIMYLICL